MSARGTAQTYQAKEGQSSPRRPTRARRWARSPIAGEQTVAYRCGPVPVAHRRTDVGLVDRGGQARGGTGRLRPRGGRQRLHHPLQHRPALEPLNPAAPLPADGGRPGLRRRSTPETPQGRSERGDRALWVQPAQYVGLSTAHRQGGGCGSSSRACSGSSARERSGGRCRTGSVPGLPCATGSGSGGTAGFSRGCWRERWPGGWAGQGGYVVGQRGLHGGPRPSGRCGDAPAGGRLGRAGKGCRQAEAAQRSKTEHGGVVPAGPNGGGASSTWPKPCPGSLGAAWPTRSTWLPTSDADPWTWS